MNGLLIIAALALLTRNRYADKTTENIRHRYAKFIENASAVYKIPTRIIAAIIRVESGGDATLKGAAGEIGLMQLLPSGALAEARRLTKLPVEAAYSPAVNIAIGTWYLSELVKRTGSLHAAIGRYNAITPSKQDAYRKKVLNAARIF